MSIPNESRAGFLPLNAAISMVDLGHAGVKRRLSSCRENLPNIIVHTSTRVCGKVNPGAEDSLADDHMGRIWEHPSPGRVF